MALYVHEAGPADAPGIVFLHGLGISSIMWQPQIDRLSKAYHCLVPDLPEHGKSSDVGLLTLENTSSLIADLIHRYTPHGRAHVVGLSMGGAVAVRLLSDTPEVIDHLVVSGTAARLGPVIAALNKLNEPLMRILRPAQLAGLMLRQFNIPQQYLPILREDLRHLKPEAISHFTDALVKVELPRGVQVPTLVAVGQKETFMAKSAARELSRTLPAKAVMVPGVSHIWNLEAPDLFTDMVRAWITDQPLPGELVLLA